MNNTTARRIPRIVENTIVLAVGWVMNLMAMLSGMALLNFWPFA